MFGEMQLLKKSELPGKKGKRVNDKVILDRD